MHVWKYAYVYCTKTIDSTFFDPRESPSLLLLLFNSKLLSPESSPFQDELGRSADSWTPQHTPVQSSENYRTQRALKYPRLLKSKIAWNTWPSIDPSAKTWVKTLTHSDTSTKRKKGHKPTHAKKSNKGDRCAKIRNFTNKKKSSVVPKTLKTL